MFSIDKNYFIKEYFLDILNNVLRIMQILLWRIHTERITRRKTQ